MKKLNDSTMFGFKVGQEVDVPYVNGHVRLKLEYFTIENDNIYANFENGSTVRKIDELRKVK